MRRDEGDSLQFEATHAVLTEVAEILEGFDGAVIAGGTVPFLLIPQEVESAMIYLYRGAKRIFIQADQSVHLRMLNHATS